MRHPSGVHRATRHVEGIIVTQCPFCHVPIVGASPRKCPRCNSVNGGRRPSFVVEPGSAVLVVDSVMEIHPPRGEGV